MIKPDIDTLKELKAQNRYKMAPLSMEILSDLRTPIEVLKILKNVSSHCYLLESVSDHEKWGRYTFLGYDPSLEITCQNGQMKVGALSFETSSLSQSLTLTVPFLQVVPRRLPLPDITLWQCLRKHFPNACR